MNILNMLNGSLRATLSSSLVWAVIIMIMLDTFLGLLRACKERRFNSCFGIDGAIRKISMLGSIIALGFIDRIMGCNFLAFVPQEVLTVVGLTKVGICEFFCLLYILYEAVSVIKNGCLCGVPMPMWLRDKLLGWLNTMTGELKDTRDKEETKDEDITDSGSR